MKRCVTHSQSLGPPPVGNRLGVPRPARLAHPATPLKRNQNRSEFRGAGRRELNFHQPAAIGKICLPRGMRFQPAIFEQQRQAAEPIPWRGILAHLAGRDLAAFAAGWSASLLKMFVRRCRCRDLSTSAVCFGNNQTNWPSRYAGCITSGIGSIGPSTSVRIGQEIHGIRNL